MKYSRKLWILALIVVLVNQFNIYALYIATSDVTTAATGTGIAQLNITQSTVTVECSNNLTTDNGRWNYLSIPVELSSGNLTTEFDSFDGSYDLVYEYNHTTGEFEYYYYSFDFGDLRYVEPGSCYVIKATDNVSATFSGSDYFQNLSESLTTNFDRWNYVGWVYNTESIDNAFSTIDGSYDLSYMYNHSTGIFHYNYQQFSIRDYYNVSYCGCQLIKATDNVTLDYSI